MDIRNNTLLILKFYHYVGSRNNYGLATDKGNTQENTKTSAILVLE